MKPPTRLPEFFEWLREASHAHWETVSIDRTICGFQIQPGTKWLPGISDGEIDAFETALAFRFPEALRVFLRYMNGTDRETVNVYADGGEPYRNGVGYYSFPRDLEAVKEKIRWICDSFEIDEGYVHENDIPHILPLVAHRFLVADRCKTHPVLSMYGTDVIPYARDLRTFLVNDVFMNHVWDSDLSPEAADVKFWLDEWGDDQGRTSPHEADL